MAGGKPGKPQKERKEEKKTAGSTVRLSNSRNRFVASFAEPLKLLTDFLNHVVNQDNK